jgi:hypothetical protein
MTNLKMKLTSSILAFCMVFCVVVVGVFAVKNVSLDVGGTIAFNAKGINATISKGLLENCSFATSSDANTKLRSITIDTTRNETTIKNSSEYKSWSGLSLVFEDTDTEPSEDNPYIAKIKFTITNNSTNESEYILVNITISGGDSAIITSATPNNETIAPGETKDCEISFTITESISATLDFSVSFNMELYTPLYYQDTDGYWYVNMGTATYNETANETIKWKYVGYIADDGETYVYSRDIADAQATKNRQAIFVQQTLVYLTSDSYEITYCNSYSDSTLCHTETGLTNVKANDYSASNIRAFLNNEDGVLRYCSYDSSTKIYSPSGDSVKFSNVYGIDLTNDEVYNKIQGRSLSSLYSNMYADGDDDMGGSVTEPSYTGYSSTAEDKIWLLSYSEALTLLSEEGNKEWMTGDLIRNPDENGEIYDFWFRSPHPNYGECAYNIDCDGGWGYNFVYCATAVCGAFILGV